MAELATVREPEWLAERRSEAARRAAELDVPRFKGKPGWEFTDLAKLDLAAFTAGGAGGAATRARSIASRRCSRRPRARLDLGQVDGRVIDGGETDGDLLVLPLTLACETHAELVERAPRHGRRHRPDVFTRSTTPAGPAARSSTSRAACASSSRSCSPRSPTPSGTALHRRMLIVLEEGAEAEVWEQHLSGTPDNETLLNIVVELRVGQNARLRFVGAQDLNEKSWVFGTQRAEVARDGALDWVALGFGSGNGKVRMDTLLAGEGSHAKVTGAYAPHGRQHVDFDTLQEHGAANTTSDLAFRGILADRSSAVWRGMIKVDPGAQQTDAFQECRNLLLSKKAHADAIPGLEILANDVRCTHAAAIAQIDPEQVFYLRSRGLDDGAAKRLVIEGFMAELVERFEAGAIREAMAGALERRLAVMLD